MSSSRFVVDAYASMIVALVLGAWAVWETRVSGVVGDVFRGDLR